MGSSVLLFVFYMHQATFSIKESIWYMNHVVKAPQKILFIGVVFGSDLKMYNSTVLNIQCGNHLNQLKAFLQLPVFII